MLQNKLSFWELLGNYSKVEIPIIQRDYAQGRKTSEVAVLREKFIYNFLIESILKDERIELDFVYGSILEEKLDEETKRIFIPLDGQQRLTTLFLLHYFIAVKEGSLDSIKKELAKFTYETRPSAHDFCSKLIKFDKVKSISNIRDEIIDSVWFNYEWKDDPTVSGMLNMLHTLSLHESLVNHKEDLLPKLLDISNKLISFYFTELTEFGLTENLYIRMNARGKTLNEFENFKSEFFKTIQYDSELLEIVKDKIEYAWVENLWPYKAKKSYLIDQPFLNYISFISEMLYFKSAEFRSKEEYASNFLDFKLLEKLYSSKENLQFLIFSLDQIKFITSSKKTILPNGDSLNKILSRIIGGKKDINDYFIIYGCLRYCFLIDDDSNLMDYLRVIRNLIINTADNSRREWPRLIPSMEDLITKENIYNGLSEISETNSMLGFKIEQRTEEIVKANIFLSFPQYKEAIFKIEDHENFKGNITTILKAPFASSRTDFKNLNSIEYDENKIKILLSIFEAYKEIAENDFDRIWGTLIDSTLYSQNYLDRLTYDENYAKHPSIIYFSKSFSMRDKNYNLDKYIENIEKKYIRKLKKEYTNFEEIADVKKQLTLYYIFHYRINKATPLSFFKKDNFNFGWLKKEKGYKSHFKNGITNSNDFENTNPIFQGYKKQFRYNTGINFLNTLDVEIIDEIKRQKPLELLVKWSLE